jgi:hypothetical protein
VPNTNLSDSVEKIKTFVLKMAQRRQIVLLDEFVGPVAPQPPKPKDNDNDPKKKQEEEDAISSSSSPKNKNNANDAKKQEPIKLPPGLDIPKEILKNINVVDKSIEKNKRLAKELANAEFFQVDQSELSKPEESSNDPSLAQVLYGDKEHQAQVASRFADPTKLQKKRHQINAMAIEAAAMELELMEQHQKGKRLRQETRSKYGW